MARAWFDLGLGDGRTSLHLPANFYLVEHAIFMTGRTENKDEQS